MNFKRFFWKAFNTERRNDVHALVDADNAAVQRQVVVLGVAPFHIGVEAMIRHTALVLIPQTLLRGPLPLAVDLHDALARNAMSAWISSNLLYSIVKHSLCFDFSCGIFVIVLALGFLSRRI